MTTVRELPIPHQNSLRSFGTGLRFRYQELCKTATYSRGKTTTIGSEGFHFCVRNGNRWSTFDITALQNSR